jgi:hypothetical protein
MATVTPTIIGPIILLFFCTVGSLAPIVFAIRPGLTKIRRKFAFKGEEFFVYHGRGKGWGLVEPLRMREWQAAEWVATAFWPRSAVPPGLSGFDSDIPSARALDYCQQRFPIRTEARVSVSPSWLPFRHLFPLCGIIRHYRRQHRLGASVLDGVLCAVQGSCRLKTSKRPMPLWPLRSWMIAV